MTNKYTDAEFQLHVSYETWDTVSNSFLNTYLKILYSSFPLIKKRKKGSSKTAWITSGIRISCTNKGELHIAGKNSKDPSCITYKKHYCKFYQG
jgi:hypothetical protein